MRMLVKVLVAITVVMVVGLKGMAQCPSPGMPQNEIGVRLASLHDASSFGGKYVSGQSMSLGFINGIHYKRYGTFGAFRASMGLTRYEEDVRTNCPQCMRTTGKVSGVTLRAGYEWYAVLGIVEPYIGIDAMAVFGKYSGNTFSTNSTTYTEYTDERTRRGMGVSPVAGLRFYLGYAVSVSAETSMDLLFVGRSTRLSQLSPETSTFARSNNYFQSVFQPVQSLSLNVMF